MKLFIWIHLITWSLAILICDFYGFYIWSGKHIWEDEHIGLLFFIQSFLFFLIPSFIIFCVLKVLIDLVKPHLKD